MHMQNVPCLIKTDDLQNAQAIYKNKIKLVLTNCVSAPLKPDKYLNEEAEGMFNENFLHIRFTNLMVQNGHYSICTGVATQ